MRKILTSIIFIMLAYGANAQQWQYSMADAMKIAKEKDQKIILVFSGSDWCTPCIKLENDIWSTDEFKIYAKDNYVMLKADFPRKKKNKLSEDHTRNLFHLGMQILKHQ
ncbi:MAG: thiol-disulfide isomerase [Bacteroidetes bacterium 4572_112]|nr:MAG: thiol-disulfide isomerase [Bacteroidetes bacterium 4572_112]